MTLQQLQKTFPEASEETWHKHPNGGGWVENTAYVNEQTYVGIDAVVAGDAQISRDARVSGNARVFGNAQINNDTWEQSPFYVQGTAYSVTSSSWAILQIGCKSLTVEEWLKRGEEIGRDNGLTDAQIAEYLAIVRCWDEIRHIRGLVREEGE